jgi:hypothetical protein
MYIGILLGAHPVLRISRIRVKNILLITLYLFIKSAEDALFAIIGVFSCLTDNRRPSTPSEDLPNLRRTSHFGEV